ncbi:MAG: hypothetical protein AB1551_08385 [Actinomycetota bacterium]
MGCLVVLLGLIAPRFVILCLWLFTDYLSRAFGGWEWPTLGFFLLPTTTIAYAMARNAFSTPQGSLRAGGILIIVLGVAIDLGLLGGGGRGIGKRSDRSSR